MIAIKGRRKSGDRMQDRILLDVLDFYKNSRDFNGIPLSGLLGDEKADKSAEYQAIRSLIEQKKIALCYATNPHIKCFPDDPVDEQLRILEVTNSREICVYPTEGVLQADASTLSFENRPFSKMLALGKPQLIPPVFFDMIVLENYFNDPRYYVDYYDYGGSISYTGDLEDRDQALLQSFGLGYRKKDRERVVAVYLRYLSDLTPEHQQRWLTYLVREDCVMSYPYYQNTIIGDWADNISIYEAFLDELFHINKMTVEVFSKSLFLNDYKDNRPDDFKIIFRPTLENYNKFIHCLDKIVSENISKDFFDAQINMKHENGQNKGTLTLLDEWLRKMIRVKDDQIFDKIIKPLKVIRKLRQKPAHKVNKNKYDKSFFKMQDEVIKSCYIAIRDIRLVLSNHPMLSGYEVPNWLLNGKIANY